MIVALAHAKGSLRVAGLPMDSVLGAQATDQRQGFMKALVGDGDDRILGFTMIGAAAGEVMAAVQTQAADRPVVVRVAGRCTYG
jgi:pyruvate/2-oxoglutarate dehydrogenase complex dihydrolipoamide dehydrogenase (E3) component